jgi:hypothetical protein
MTGIYLAIVNQVSILDYIAALCSEDVWIEAAIGIGIGTVVGMGIKAIAKKLSCNMVLFLGTIMSLWSLYQSINLSIDMINGGVSREQVARYLAVLTATVILTTLIGKVCFTEDTLIKTDDGYKEIKDIEVGDLVYSEDPLTGEKGLKKVTNVFVNETSVIVRVFVEDEEIETTPTHPFWVIGKGWVAAGDMEVGDKVYLYSCDSREIKELKFEHLDSPIKVYNFEVEDWHTYFVSEQDVFVHNSCGDDMLGSKGSQTSSKTTWSRGKTERIDVENPAPGKRPGQIHYHEPNNTKWYYDIDNNQFYDQKTGNLASNKIQKLLKDSSFIQGIKKALKVLGV